MHKKTIEFAIYKMQQLYRKYLPLMISILLELKSMHLLDLLAVILEIKTRQNRLGIMYMQQDVYSKILSSIMNGDNKTTKMYLRLSSASFRKIVTHIPKKRHGWSVDLRCCWRSLN
ncbi:PREDICTED: uncharacterized protein LOC108375099 isoform X1 [Rhagoletis zephyria]|uniref:uncharacterized protein LOC108355939 isoform X1 n=1 Tax=Rhagoletis zephyria TaxID=28612 RepID=UPI0008117BF8|nr:PREDICTED: uncharacterized protein LOC108355939 isoform X1 [Rhagoletis zephyria]XP_017472279.1 PREDICTED: uncharacterized protein LOC108363422 isoform X1 [Rhagoletis zephyria]XP_017479921.1 PREDICTED: uncharacterized protein LOC108369340 isoform X1 [Rhagoletis zephyria]XP_017482498.1 PREDICTED: uncharacterized protein LOC108371445 isoform X1 [Rhagoletis zephyria]XP_017486707.1 PREDICTED: uncharacterized protein LOC108375099 isoform X1 [Rhagoletis zephyria]